jgi:hypothetical protein
MCISLGSGKWIQITEPPNKLRLTGLKVLNILVDFSSAAKEAAEKVEMLTSAAKVAIKTKCL